jgi:hypothetical protein
MLDADFPDSDSFFENGIESEGERLHRRHDIGELVLKVRNDLYVVTQNTLYAFIGEKRGGCCFDDARLIAKHKLDKI